ncbi:MAG: hypothetical protein ABJQ29_08680 [Luteolibacter sp.]
MGLARTSGNGGFALIVTLTLMILLTVVTVVLLTLSSISLRASTQGQTMSETKANAEMQKAAGLDQRITAAADGLSSLTNDSPPFPRPPIRPNGGFRSYPPKANS